VVCVEVYILSNDVVTKLFTGPHQSESFFFDLLVAFLGVSHGLRCEGDWLPVFVLLLQ
jgi:hypothetical protein